MPIGKPREGTYGIMAEFNDAQSLLDAANATREAGIATSMRTRRSRFMA